jgi:ribosomal protein S20
VEPRWVENVPHARAAIYDGEAITALAEFEGAFNSRGHGINDAGVVVGEMGITWYESRAVVWQDGVPYDLNLRLVEPLDVVLSKASAVNGRGQIIAIGVTGILPYHGRTRSFLLTPATPAGVVGELVGSIDDLVEAGTLNSGQGNSLLVKLEKALAAIEAGDGAKAVAMLEAFVHEVHAFENAGILTETVAADLVRRVEIAISSLSH